VWDSTEVYLQQKTSIYTTRQSRHRSHGTWHIFPLSPILDLQVHTVWHRREGRQTVRMRSAGWRPLGGSLPTSLSIPLELSPYTISNTWYLHAPPSRIWLRFSVKLYQRRDVNGTLSSTLEVVLRQVRVLIPQSKILQREYRKRELVIPFSFWSVFILTRNVTIITMW